MNLHTRHIHERPGLGRLGRHVEHDERSRAFAVSHGPVKSATWKRHCPIFDQGNLGSCTGNAAAGARMTGPLFTLGDAILTEEDAVEIYKVATRCDRIPGEYPPDDTGSSGLAAARAMQKHGLITSYAHAFGIQQALIALSNGPVMIGIDWFDGFDTPQGTHAELVISGEPRGGHEMVADMLDVENGYIGGANSWGPGWGNKGRWVMTLGTFKQLLAREGDVVVPVR